MIQRLLPGRLGRTSYERMLERWRDAIDRLSVEEMKEARPLLERGLMEADSETAYRSTGQMLLDLAVAADRAAERLRSLADWVTALRHEWTESRRYTPAGLEALEHDLVEQFDKEPEEAARRWLNELLDAMRVREEKALHRIASGHFAFAPKQKQGATIIQQRLLAWQEGEPKAALDLLSTVAHGGPSGWDDLIDASMQSRAHRLAAWFGLRVLGDPPQALDHLASGAELDPMSGPNQADLAAFFLYEGDVERAAPHAQRAIEIAPDDPAGYLELGAWAEFAGQFEEAGELFVRALDRMPVHAIAMMRQRASLLDPPGALLLAAAERLVSAGKASEAVDTIDAALLAGIRGRQPFPDADAHRLLSRALQLANRGTTADAARAAVEAAKRYLWNGQLDEAIDQLKRSQRLDDTIEEIGWLLTDALVSKSFPTGTARPDPDLLAQGREAWEKSLARVGPPKDSTSWAYLTRAEIADLESLAPGQDRGLGLWEANVHIERAIVHDETEARRWGYAARYQRACGLELNALEAAERGVALDPTDALVLGERLALLADSQRLDEAVVAADELVATYGPDPWVSGIQAWLAFHQNRSAEALTFLELPLANEYDLGWYYGLRALCFLDLGNIDAALEDYRTIRDIVPALGGMAALQRAIACLTLGDTEGARTALEVARGDSEPSEGDYLMVEALSAFASGELDRGKTLFLQAIEEARNLPELEDLVRNTRLRLRMLDKAKGAAAEVVINSLESRNVAARRQALERSRPSPEQELAVALQEHDQPDEKTKIPITALLAIRGRHLAQVGQLAKAAADYQRLSGSLLFEPEAAIALSRALLGASAVSAEHHDVDEVTRIQTRLQELGLADPVDAAISVAGALEAAGRPDEARTQLTDALGQEMTDERRQELLQRIGELALRAGDFNEAKNALEAALELAQKKGDPGRSAQLQARLSLVSLASRDYGGGFDHLKGALRAWKAAGALEPRGPLEDDFRALAPADAASSDSPGFRAIEDALESLKQKRDRATFSDSAEMQQDAPQRTD